MGRTTGKPRPSGSPCRSKQVLILWSLLSTIITIISVVRMIKIKAILDFFVFVLNYSTRVGKLRWLLGNMGQMILLRRQLRQKAFKKLCLEMLVLLLIMVNVSLKYIYLLIFLVIQKIKQGIFNWVLVFII